LSTPTNGWKAGRTGLTWLSATVAPQVTDVGEVVLPLRSGGLWIADYPAGCTGAEDAITCDDLAVDQGKVRVGPFAVTVLPSTSGPQALSATLSGGRPSSISADDGGPINAIPMHPGDPIDMTGPFGADLVGAAMMRCNAPEPFDRGTCRMSSMDRNPVTRSTAVPDGATVLWAQLMWAATGPSTADSGCPWRSAGPLDCINLKVGDTSRWVLGTPQPGAPDTAGELVVRTADVTDMMGSPGSVSATGLAASTTTSTNLPAMAAWSLVVIWTADKTPTSTVQLQNSLLGNSSSAGAGTVTTVAPAGRHIEDLRATVWAVDDWARKSLSVDAAGGQTVLTSSIDGNCAVPVPGAPLGDAGFLQYACGFQILGPFDADALQSSTDAAIRLTNTVENRRVDRLWIGPTLVIRAPA
jgi:hypothetical protein